MDTPETTRYVRVRGVERATRFRYSLWSLEVYAVREGGKPGRHGDADGKAEHGGNGDGNGGRARR
jgi:hyaluronoglucosaminidase